MNNGFVVRPIVSEKELHQAVKLAVDTRIDPEQGGLITYEPPSTIEHRHATGFRAISRLERGRLLGLFQKETGELAGVAALVPLNTFDNYEPFSREPYRILTTRIGEKPPVEKIATIVGTSVAKKFEGKKGATLLLTNLEEWARNHFDHLIFDTCNKKIETFGKKHGYSYLGEYVDGMPWQVYHKDLRQAK